MRTVDIISGAVIVGFGLALIFVIIPVWVPTILEGDYGLRAKDMPNVAAITVTGLAVFFMIGRVLGTKDVAEEAAPIDRDNWLFLFKASLFLIAVVALFHWVGFLVAGPVTIGGCMFMMGERRIIPLVLTAGGATLGIWLFFWQLLRFPLP